MSPTPFDQEAPRPAAPAGVVTQNSGSAEKRGAGWFSRAALVVAAAGFLSAMFYLNLSVHGEQQFSLLGSSFLHGRLSFAEAPGGRWDDTTLAHGQHYWPLGPLPAVILMPLEAVAGGGAVDQGYLQPLLVLGLLAAVFRMARLIGYDSDDAAYLAFGFAFSTAFLGVALWPWSWYFSQVLCSLVLCAAVTETLGRRRPWVIGVLFALVLATRVTAALGLIWPVAEMLRERDRSWQEKIRGLVEMGLPCALVLGMLLWYNFARFGNAFDQGYAAQIIPPHAMAGRAVGVLSPRHLPGNLYWMLLAAPTPVRADGVSLVLKFPYLVANPWGMSIFVTSPCFMLLFALRHRDATAGFLWLTIIVIALPILFYYGIGFRQFGYRYSLDFLPFLYCLLLRAYRAQRGALSGAFKAALVLSALMNLYLFAGYFCMGIQ